MKKAFIKEFISKAPSPSRGEGNAPAFGTPSLDNAPQLRFPPSLAKRGLGGVSDSRRGKGELISPPLRGGDEGEGDRCGFANDSIGKSLKPTLPTTGHGFFRTVIASVLLMFIAIVTFPSVSISSETDDSIEKIQKAYEKIRDMKGAFTQKNIIKDLNKTDTYKGEFYIKQPLKMKWLYTGKAAQDIFINNDTVMIYKKGDKQAYKGKFDKKTYGQTPIALLGGFGNIRQEFNISGRGNSLLLKPKSPLGNITSISLTLSEDDFPIKSFTIQDGRSNVIEIVMRNVRTNTGLKDSLFEFQLPKEVNVFEYNP